MFLTKGIQGVASHIGSTYLGMAIGTSSTAVAVTDNGCLTETQRVASTNTITTSVITNDNSKHIGSFTNSGSSIVLREAAVMTTSTTGGDSAARQVFGAVTYDPSDTVVFEFNFTVS